MFICRVSKWEQSAYFWPASTSFHHFLLNVVTSGLSRHHESYLPTIWNRFDSPVQKCSKREGQQPKLHAFLLCHSERPAFPSRPTAKMGKAKFWEGDKMETCTKGDGSGQEIEGDFWWLGDFNKTILPKSLVGFKSSRTVQNAQVKTIKPNSGSNIAVEDLLPTTPTNLAKPRKSLNSTLRRGKKVLLQNGQVVFKLESSAVHPAMISSS